MTRREEFKKAMSHPSNGPLFVDFGKHIGSIHKEGYKKLKALLSDLDLKNDNVLADRMAMTVVPDEALLKRFDVDFRWLYPNLSAGAKDVDDTHYKDMWGVTFHYTGDHWAITGSPLADAEIEDLDNYNWPDPDNEALFAGLEEQAKQLFDETDYIIGADGLKCGILMTALQMRGYENFLCDLLSDPEFADALLDKLLSIMKQMWTNYLKKVGKYVQIVYLTDDYGSQNSLLISQAVFCSMIKERNKQLIDHIKDLADVSVMFHCDGAIETILNDMIETGVDILNPVQTSTFGMEDTAALKAKYGDRLCFHGAIDVQKVLPNATVEQVREEVIRRVNDLNGKNGGLILAPCHNVGHDIPVENLVALYDAAKEIRSR